MREAALAFLSSLSESQRGRASAPFGVDGRFDWHYIPRERQGLCFKLMSAPQGELALSLLRVGLGDKGYSKAEMIRRLETVLFQLEGRSHRDPGLYYFTIFGEPSEKEPWGWRYEGHHLSQNWTIVGGRAIATSPQFFGANPAKVRAGPLKGTRPLAAEEDLARSLLFSLDPSQRTAAIVSHQAPPDIITAAARRASRLEDRGIAYHLLDAAQKEALEGLIREHAHTLAPALAEDRILRLGDAGLAHVKFAWMGGAGEGEGHYYRIQGSTFLIEYDNTQNGGNHAHAVWRDFDGDFGLDLLDEHYRAARH
jgi:hypothetical protein